MSSIVVATSRDEVRAETILPLIREGYSVHPVADWAGLCRAITAEETRLAVIDPELPGLDAPLLCALAASLPSRPVLRTVGRAVPPLLRVPGTALAMGRLARQAVGVMGMALAERRALRWYGLGEEPLDLLGRVAMSPLPVLLHGERGTGKERLARVLHRLRGRGGPLVTLPVHAPWLPGSRRASDGAALPTGTLFLESVHRRDDTRAVVRAALAAGWTVAAGSRLAEPVPGVEWARVMLPPLRDRPNDLRQLALHYLDVHARRMGLPHRSFDRGLWALLHAHRWPSNVRELEMFVVQTLSSVDQPTIRGATLPEDLRALLLPRGDAAVREAEGFEDMARLRLMPVVAAFQPGTVGAPREGTLHGLVIGSAERALIQLVLARTGGNRKAAAALLGVARNTLQARIEALEITASRG